MLLLLTSCDQMSKFTRDNQDNVNKDVLIKIQQIDYLLKIIKIKNKTEIMNMTQSEIFTLEGIRLRHPNFEYDKIHNRIYAIINNRSMN